MRRIILKRNASCLVFLIAVFLGYVAVSSIIAYCEDVEVIPVVKSIRMRWAGHVARMRERRGAYRFLVGKPEGKRPRRRWEDNSKMDLQEVGWGFGMD